MLKNTLTGLDKKKLQRWLLLFFFALAIPTAILIQQSYSRLKWETFHQHQLMADELSSRINNEFLRLIDIEEQRSFTDYSFLNIAGDPRANFLQRSPLSSFPIESEIAGLIGYFQVDNKGRLITPLLPESIKLDTEGDIYGITKTELASRTQLQNQIQSILSQNSLVKTPAPLVIKDADKNAEMGFENDELIKSISTKDTKEEKPSMLGRILGSSQSKRDSSSPYSSSFSAGDDVAISENRVAEPSAQIAFDRLKTIAPKRAQRESNLGRVEDLKFAKNYMSKEEETKKSIAAQKKRASKNKSEAISKLNKRAKVRKEQNVLPESEMFRQSSALNNKPTVNKPREKSAPAFDLAFSDTAVQTLSSETKINKAETSEAEAVLETASANYNRPNSPREINKQNLRIRTFESSIDPFEFSQLDSGHFVFYRNVWLNEKRYIQGLLINEKVFLESIINLPFRETALSDMSDLLISYQGNILEVLSKQDSESYLPANADYSGELKGELLHQTRLSAPLSELQLLFSVRQLPIGAGGKIILWLSLLLASVLCAGFYLMYRLGLGQINLANQQQDFVSAVSHELKTPLTSIRMYSEILREGWANDEKKKTYYDFIFDESERLSRLINNVLHLARVTRNKQSPELSSHSVAELMDGIRSKVSTQIKHAGFEFSINCDDATKTKMLELDEDWFSQIMINLVDNAIKFSANSTQKKIELHCEESSKGQIQFSVRDFGPGVDKAQMKKIFDLFYRTESELTRETVGTGIGLALVHQMTVSMGGKIDVVTREPGAEFRVLFSSAVL